MDRKPALAGDPIVPPMNPDTQRAPQPPQGPGRPTYSKRGKITSVACIPCRKRKTKCDGARPACTQCRQRDGKCSYDMSEEDRRLTVLRSTNKDLSEDLNANLSLITTLQSSTDDEALELMRRLRSGEDATVIAREVHAQHGQPEPTEPETSARTGGGSSARGTRTQAYESLFYWMVNATPIELEEILRRLKLGEDIPGVLADINNSTLLQPLGDTDGNVTPGLEADYSKRATTFGLVKGAAYQESRAPRAHNPLGKHQRWTTVTDDEEFINHLLDLYFAWQHCFFQSFPEDLFRSDMASGGTKYCSSLMVNAVCAAGCLLSQRPRARRDPQDCKTAGLDFYEEALRLLNNEVRVSSIPTTAALFLLCHVEGNRGYLSSLWAFCGRSSRMALDLNLHLRYDRTVVEASEEAQEEDFARRHAFWGCYISDVLTSFTLGRIPQVPTSAITIDLPPVSEDVDGQKWNAYDTPGPERPGARSTCFNLVASLAKIVNSTLCMFFAPTRVLSGSLLLVEYQKYTTWHQRLPEMVQSTKEAPPHVLCLHMFYHAAVLLLFRPFLKAKFIESDISPVEICRQAANAISDLFGTHVRLYGLVGLYTFQVHCLLTACTIHIINVPAIASTSYLTQACKQFHDLLPRNEWAAGSLNIIKGLIQKWNRVLPQETEEALYRLPVSGFDFAPTAEQASASFIPDPATVSPTAQDQNPQSFPDARTQRDAIFQASVAAPSSSSNLPMHPSSLTTTTTMTTSSSNNNNNNNNNSGKRHHNDSPPGGTSAPPTARQRVQTRSAPPDTSMNNPTQGLTSQPQPHQPSTSSSSAAPTNPRQTPLPTDYLFAPFPTQPAPLLGPVHTSEGVLQEGHETEDGLELGERMNRFDGLSFEDDGIYDPFMGWSGERAGPRAFDLTR